MLMYAMLEMPDKITRLCPQAISFQIFPNRLEKYRLYAKLPQFILLTFLILYMINTQK